MSTFYRDNKLVANLLVAGLLVIAIGTVTVSYFNRQAQQTALANEQVQRITDVAMQAEQQLQTTVVNNSGDAIADIIPAVSVARVAAMEARDPIVGSADWCETRMVKPADEWTLEDQQTFAKHCI